MADADAAPIREHFDMQRVGGGSALVGGLVALAFILAITALVYGLREIMPAVSTGVVYLLAVLLVSTYWGLWLGLATAVASAAVSRSDRAE